MREEPSEKKNLHWIEWHWSIAYHKYLSYASKVNSLSTCKIKLREAAVKITTLEKNSLSPSEKWDWAIKSESPRYLQPARVVLWLLIVHFSTTVECSVLVVADVKITFHGTVLNGLKSSIQTQGVTKLQKSLIWDRKKSPDIYKLQQSLLA